MKPFFIDRMFNIIKVNGIWIIKSSLRFIK